MAANKHTAADMLSMLEERLARVDLLVNGGGEAQLGDGIQQQTMMTATTTSATTRLRALERAMKSLAAKSHTVSDLLQLHQQHPELFSPADPQRVPSTLPPASLAQLALAHDQLYRTTASQLVILNENKDIPDPSSLAKLITLQPRTDRAEARLAEQAQEFAELRYRSARIVEQWYENGILDMGEKWADWEERLRDCEILVRRREAAKKREEGTL